MPDIPHSLPSQLSEKNFRLYEPHIKRAVERWPDETEFSTSCFLGEHDKPLSGNTWVARFRDAITSVKRFEWSTNINTEKLWAMANQFVVATDAATGSAWVRPRGRKGRPTHLTNEARERGVMVDADIIRSVWTNVQPIEIRSLCVLLHYERLTGPLTIEGSLPAELVAELETEFNVSFFSDVEKNVTLIS